LNRTYEIKINFKTIENFIKIKEYNKELINKFNFINYVNGNWIPIEQKNKDVLIGTHVSQFGFEPIINLNYDKDFKPQNSNKKKKSLYIPSFQNNLLVLKINTTFLKFGTTYEYKIIENDSTYVYNNNDNIGIIGYIGNSKDLWYPAFYKYDEYFSQINENLKNKKPIEVLKSIRDKYENIVIKSKIIGDYSVLAYKLSKFGSEWDYKDKIKHLKNLLNEIAKILNDNNIIEQIKKLEKLEKDSERYEQTIYRIYVNTIYLLYSLFKKRYQFIKICSYNIIFSCLSKEKLNKKSEELLNKYFSYDSSKSLDKQYILN
jgi:hypothetical protein